MSEKMRESISALMDGEASDFEARRVLESMDSADLRDVWARYHVASAAMKRDAASLSMQIDISAAVSEAIAKEEALVVPANRPMRTAAGFATAATLAFAAVIGVQNFGSEEDTPTSSLIASSSRSTPVIATHSRHAPPIAAPSATLASSSLSRSTLGIQPVAMASSSAAANENAVRELSLASREAAQRQMETFVARHGELSGLWRPAVAEQASMSMQADEPSREGGGQWQARWLPSGYRLVAVNNDVASDSSTPVLTSVYSNGLAAISVFVSAAHGEPPMDMRRGSTVACSRRIHSGGNAYTATVVGNISPLSAERVATSVFQVPAR